MEAFSTLMRTKPHTGSSILRAVWPARPTLQPRLERGQSTVKLVDNHTTSMGMMEIDGSRAGRFMRNDSVQLH